MWDAVLLKLQVSKWIFRLTLHPGLNAIMDFFFVLTKAKRVIGENHTKLEQQYKHGFLLKRIIKAFEKISL